MYCAESNFGVNLGIDSIVVKGEPSSGTRSRSSTGTLCLCTNSFKREVVKHDIDLGRESESSMGVDEEQLSIKKEPSFEWSCDVKAKTNDKLNVESESSLTLRHSVVKVEPICTEEEDMKPVIKPECLTDICMVETEPLFGHFSDFHDEVKPKVENFVKEEVSEWEGPDFGEVGKTEGQVEDVEDTCAEPVFVEDHMSQAGGLQLQISNVRSLCMEQSTSPDTDVFASSSPTSTFSADPVTSSGSVVRAIWDHSESSRKRLNRSSKHESCSKSRMSCDSKQSMGQGSDFNLSCAVSFASCINSMEFSSTTPPKVCKEMGAGCQDLPRFLVKESRYSGEQPHKCNVCLEMFTELGNLQKHKRTHTRDRLFKCEVCCATFTCGRNLQTHKRTHTGEKPYKCEICGATFTQGSSLQHHKRTHTGEKPYECKVCGATFTKRSNLQSHRRTHTGEKPYKCEVCEARFTQSSHLQRHKRTHTGEKPYKKMSFTNPTLTLEEESPPLVFTTGPRAGSGSGSGVGTCSPQTTVLTLENMEQEEEEEDVSLTGRQSRQRPRSVKFQEGGFVHFTPDRFKPMEVSWPLFREKPYKCEVCEARFTQSSHLQRHKRTHTGEKPYKCEDCGVTFTQSSNLECHKRTHTGEKPYKCEVCGATFTFSSGLQSHKRTHSEEKPYKCEVCGSMFKCSISLQCHKRIHTGEKPYKCEVCGATFKCSSSFRNHKRIHTGEEPYKCEVCGATFTCNSSLRNHERIHTGEKPYKCEVCGATFTQSGNLQRHKRTHTGGKPYKYKCEVCGATFTFSDRLQRHREIHTRQKSDKSSPESRTIVSAISTEIGSKIQPDYKFYILDL
ncbi:LOW QUALITY PROTEIN: zinc finger protein 678 [Aplysia californica]|uniref:LOW QUALITY PROTEIN: zinc finger protein 678 n=1 Tax=Aplysia californica TaxID=6500 RepID=A0ABM1VRD5_APLCA|nr:LOW QUALITY PROTEIN: zinc finger protein 678 [Aplysia californica]